MKINENGKWGQVRQGDVAIVNTKTNRNIDKTGLQQIISKERIILALGEVTGHHHSISVKDYPDCKLWKYDESINILTVPAGGVTIEHQEHEVITPLYIPEGDYEIHIQEEYDPVTKRRNRISD